MTVQFREPEKQYLGKRRKTGDVVFKRAGAGFSGLAGRGVIAVGSEPDLCILGCGDPECQEWPDVWALGEDGQPNGENWCHVSECEMQDDPGGPLSAPGEE